MSPGLAAASRRPGSRAFAWAPHALVLLAALSLSACKITRSDIDTWKGTVKGPGKMVAVLLADKYELDLRTYAALALIQLDRRDVDGLTELQQAILRLDAGVRERIVAQLVPGLVERLQPVPAAALNDALPAQVRAKDAAFVLLPYANDDGRKRLTDAMMRWYTADFEARSLAGHHSAEQVVRGLGAAAATTLVDALDVRLPPAALIKLAELIGQLGNAQTRPRAAQKLLAIEAEMHSERFLAAIKAQLSSQIAAPAKGAQASKQLAERVDKAAAQNRERLIDEGALPALSHLADQPEVAARLLAIAADRTQAAERRIRALQALEGKVSEAQVDALLALALESGAPAALQDAAFDRLGDARSPKAIPALWPLLARAESPKLRGRAGELVLSIGGPAILPEFFSKLPAGAEVSYEPDELEGYAARMGQMSPLPVSIASAQLSSRQWWARVIALNFFARKGTDKDLESIQPLLGDATPVRGTNWEANTTIGRLAKQTIDTLREKSQRPQG